MRQTEKQYSELGTELFVSHVD